MPQDDEDGVPYDRIPETLGIPLPSPQAHLHVMRREALKKLLSGLQPKYGPGMMLGDSPNDSPLDLLAKRDREPLMEMEVPPPTLKEASGLRKRIQEFLFRRGKAEGRSM